MKKLSLWIAGIAFSATACAQQNSTALKYSNVINTADAKKHLSILASDEFEGRETGKPGADKAARYIANEFKLMGLQPIVNGSYFFDVPLSEKLLKVTLSVNGQLLENAVDYYAARTAEEGKIDASEIVFVGYGTEAEIGNTNLTGKIVLWINEDKAADGKPANTSFRGSEARALIGKNLYSKKPAMILSVNTEVAGIIKRFFKNSISRPHIGIKRSDKLADKSTDTFWITNAMADQLLKSTGKTLADFKAAGGNSQIIKTDFKLSYKTETNDVKAVDVLGFLPGSDAKLKDEVLVFSAHYDHIGLVSKPDATDKVNNGADDDGSGTTAIIELARAFSQAKKDGHGPKRSILFLGNVGEEKGLLGSEYYTDHPVIPLANTIANLNIDMIGRIGNDYLGKPAAENYVYVVGSDMLSSDLKKINEHANSTYTKLDLNYKYDDPKDPEDIYHRSDHYNFAKHNVPIIFYYNGEHADYHAPGDEVSKINFPLLVKRAQLAFFTGWELANRDARPVVDKADAAKGTR